MNSSHSQDNEAEAAGLSSFNDQFNRGEGESDEHSLRRLAHQFSQSSNINYQFGSHCENERSQGIIANFSYNDDGNEASRSNCLSSSSPDQQRSQISSQNQRPSSQQNSSSAHLHSQSVFQYNRVQGQPTNSSFFNNQRIPQASHRLIPEQHHLAPFSVQHQQSEQYINQGRPLNNQDHELQNARLKQQQAAANEIKCQVIQKLIHEKGGYLQNLQQVVAKKHILYRKQGLSNAEALNKIVNKLIKKRFQQQYGSSTPPLYSDNCSSGGNDQELLSKIRKQSGMTLEEIQKTLQLKKEIEFLLESRLHQDSESSEDSVNSNKEYQMYQQYNAGGAYHNGQLSPQTYEKQKTERKYQKKYKKVFDTIIDRVENQSSSGNNSGDEKHGGRLTGSQSYQKKRKYQDFAGNKEEIQDCGGYKVHLHQAKRRHQNELNSQTNASSQQQQTKKRQLKDMHASTTSNNQCDNDNGAAGQIQQSNVTYSEHNRGIKRFRNEY